MKVVPIVMAKSKQRGKSELPGRQAVVVVWCFVIRFGGRSDVVLSYF